MMKISKILFFLCLALLARSVSAQTGFWLPVNANGWTVVTPTDDGPEEDRTRRVYVSNSGDDVANDGLSPESPKKTIDAAMAITRDGYPDWILLKRGDTFAGTSFANRRWKSGRSASEPMVMTYYGDSGPRPIIKLTSALVNWDGQNRSHVAFIGLDLYRSISDPDSPDFTNSSSAPGLRFVPSISGDIANVLVEDCLLRYCDIIAEAIGSGGRPRNVVIRRNVVSYVWVHNTTQAPNSQRTSGIFVSGVDGLILEENVFHHNGFSLKVIGAGANIFSHNVYLQYNLGGTILLRGNILSHGAAHGVQLRSGGTVEMNAFVGNAVAMNLGNSPQYTDLTTVDDNVVTDGRPMIPNKITHPQSGAIWGFDKGGAAMTGPVTANDNIIANIKDTRGSYSQHYVNFNGGLTSYGSGNIGWNWVASNIPATDPGFTDHTRNGDSYGQHLGLNSWKGFIEAASNRPLGQMPLNLTAYAYVNYIRAGFNKLPVTPPYSNYNDCQGIPATGITILPSQVTLVAPGDTKELIATFIPSDACNRGLTWSSDNEDIATVDADGVVTAGAVAGTATITVTAGGGTLTSSVEVTVTGVVGVTGVTLSRQNLSLELGGSETLAASILPANATHKEVTWSSNKPTVAVVNAQGVVVGVSNGTATITVTTVEGGFTAECEVTVTGNGGYLLDAVNNAYIGSGSFRARGVQTSEGNGIRSIFAYQPGVAMPAPDGSTWPVSYGGWNYMSPNVTSVYHDFSYLTSASNPDIRAIRFQNNEGGTLRAMIYWPMALTVPFDKLSLSVTLGTGSGINTANVHFLVKSGNNFYISAASENNHSRIFERAATSTDWYLWDFAANSGNNFNPVFENPVAASDIAIDAIGLFITGQTASGMVLRDIRQVKYTYEDFTPVSVTGIGVSPETLTIWEGGTGQLTATVLPADAANTSIVWSSDNESVATVNTSGLVTAVSPGTATITATTVDGDFTAESEVTVAELEEHYLLDAVNIDYGRGPSSIGSNARKIDEGEHNRSVYAYNPNQVFPIPQGTTWPAGYGGWSYSTPKPATTNHRVDYYTSIGDQKLRFQNSSGGSLRALIYYPMPSPARFDKLNLSVTLGAGTRDATKTHFVVKSGNNIYISARSESSYNKVFSLATTSTDWCLWDFAANNGDNFNPALENPVAANNISIDAIGIFITGDNTSSIYRDLTQVMYTAEGTVLPVKLAHFTAEKENNTAQLRWSTTEEANSSHFEVQHSLDARSWIGLGEVASGRESKVLRSYGHSHAHPASGINYYRLKMVDRDGTFEFSPIKSVMIEKTDITSVYPNPSTGRFFLKNSDGPIGSLEIFNLAGTRVVSLSSIPSDGVDVGDLIEGLYIVKVRKKDGTVVNNKIVIQK